MQPNDFYTINTKWNYTNASVQMNGDVFLNKLQFYIVVADFHFIIHSFLLSLRVYFFHSFFLYGVRVCACAHLFRKWSHLSFDGNCIASVMKVKQSTYLIGIVLFLLFNGFTCWKLCRCKIKWIWKKFRTKMQMIANPVLKTTRNDLFWNCSYSAYMAMTSTLNLSVYDSALFCFFVMITHQTHSTTQTTKIRNRANKK